MKPEVIIPVCSQIHNEEDGSFDATSMKYLDKFLRFKPEGSIYIQASDVSQYRLMPATSANGSRNRYPVDQAKQFMLKISEAGFGNCEEVTKTGSKRKTLIFRKRSFSELGEPPQELLKRIHLDQNTYDTAMETNDPDIQGSEAAWRHRIAQ